MRKPDWPHSASRRCILSGLVVRLSLQRHRILGELRPFHVALCKTRLQNSLSVTMTAGAGAYARLIGVTICSVLLLSGSMAVRIGKRCFGSHLPS